MKRRTPPPESEGWDDDSSDDAPDGDGFESERPETAFCPECGAEIYDAADVCPKCFAWIDGDTTRHAPHGRRRSERFVKFVVWALIIARAMGAGLFGVLALIPRRA